ncbi:hypothetical protein [Solidesulfovibrio sp.]|uniref:hypothetical protein n=1 Tax=Solidesulfovibrio sp. TaxID=2910990 RepID=UPI002B207F06|nr:hypothetical protein [Solidesulfovibrio sp.]MEA5089265.1 hypothetical protein [Solidesulfovibrio sp.]
MEKQSQGIKTLFYRLWSLEYVSRNNNFINDKNKISALENKLEPYSKIMLDELDDYYKKRGISVTHEELVDKLSEGKEHLRNDIIKELDEYDENYPWQKDECHIFDKDRFILDEFIKLKSYTDLPDSMKSIMAEGFFISEECELRYGFSLYERPARSSEYILLNINTPTRMVFPYHNRGISPGYKIEVFGNFDDKRKIIAREEHKKDIIYSGRPGDFFLCLNFNEPLPIVVDWITRLYNFYIKKDDFSSDDLSTESLRATALGECTPKSQAPRAAGLWLWDRVKDLGGGEGAKTQAIGELQERFDLNSLGLGNKEIPEFYHYLRRTEACIDAAKVLPFDKKKSQAQKPKHPSGTRKRKLVPGTKTAK